MPRVLITETVLRDAQQSLVQGRLKLQHVLPIAKNLDDIGYHALDAWGGWTFAASVRALQEDPWQRLRALRGAIEKTPLQMLIRGQTLIAQSHQPDDVVRAFIQQAVEDGIRVVRMFDPLNDLRNLEVPVEAAHKALAWGASQPATETMVASLHDGPYDTGLDLTLISQASRYFDEIHDEYLEFQDPIAFRNDVYVLEHQLPAPVLAVMIRNLRERKAIDRYDRLMHELVQVRQEMGYPPMAAPINRIAANQALANTLSDKRYQHIDQPFRDYVKGLYGAPPAPIDAQVRKRALGSSEAITLRPADLLQPGLDRARREMRKQGLTPTGIDQVLTYILFPDEAPGILRPSARRVEQAPAASSSQPADPGPAPTPVAAPEPPTTPPPAAREFTVEVDGEPYRVRILADGVSGAAAGAARAALTAPSAARVARGNGAIQAPMQGMVVKVKVAPGDKVRLGDVVVVLEAMKMQNDIVATLGGTVREVFAKEGSIVAPNEVLMTIG